MTEITLQERIDWFNYTLNNCGSFLLGSSDDDIIFMLFTEFADSWSSMCVNSLKILRDANFINDGIVQMCLKVKDLYASISHMALTNSELWTPEAVRTLPIWREVLDLSDQIKKEIDCMKIIKFPTSDHQNRNN